DGLGWSATYDAPGEILFLQVGHGLLLALWGAAELAADSGDGTGRDGEPDSAGPPGFTLAHNVGSPAEVDATLDAARRAGATVLKPGQRAAFGGYHGYFADPAGIRWEVAHNPGWSVAADGTVTLRAVDCTLRAVD